MNIYTQIRLKMKLTQKEMAKILEVTPRAVQYYESGNRVPRGTYLLKYQELGDSLGISDNKDISDKDYLGILKNIHTIREELDIIEKFILEHIE